uniref:uncharacterized protein isoform X2 n=1 Tax=Myxine glutinosa TaxID=7769 RepID=UPI00358ED590
MDREPLNCAHDLSSSGSNGGDRGPRGGPGGAAGICGFRILDVQNLREGGDEPAVLTDSIVVVKVEPEQTNDSLSKDSIVVVKVEPEQTDDSLSKGQMVPVEAGCLYGNAFRTSDGIHIKEELSEDALSAEEGSTTTFSTFSSTKNVHTSKRSLQQHQKSHFTKSMDYEQNLRPEQVGKMSTNSGRK